MCRIQANVGGAAVCGLLEGIRLGVLLVAASTLDRAELFAAWLGTHQNDVAGRLRGYGRLTRRNDATEENGG